MATKKKATKDRPTQPQADVVFTGELFRIRVEKGTPRVTSSTGDLAYLELEDDVNWHAKADFDTYWLEDLLDVVTAAYKSKKVRKSIR